MHICIFKTNLIWPSNPFLHNVLNKGFETLLHITQLLQNIREGHKIMEILEYGNPKSCKHLTGLLTIFIINHVLSKTSLF